MKKLMLLFALIWLVNVGPAIALTTDEFIGLYRNEGLGEKCQNYFNIFTEKITGNGDFISSSPGGFYRSYWSLFLLKDKKSIVQLLLPEKAARKLEQGRTYNFAGDMAFCGEVRGIPSILAITTSIEGMSEQDIRPSVTTNYINSNVKLLKSEASAKAFTRYIYWLPFTFIGAYQSTGSQWTSEYAGVWFKIPEGEFLVNCAIKKSEANQLTDGNWKISGKVEDVKIRQGKVTLYIWGGSIKKVN